MATEAQVRANTENGKLGGPKTPEGKAVSRMNALKHSIFAAALSDRDRQELHTLREEFVEGFRPEGMGEKLLVERLAMVHLRMYRCARAEATYQEKIWEEVAPPAPEPHPEPPRRRKKKGEAAAPEPALAPEPPAPPPPPPPQYKFDHYAFERATQLFWRYDTTFTNQTLRIIKELTALQKERRKVDDAGHRFPQIHTDEEKKGDDRAEGRTEDKAQGTGVSDGEWRMPKLARRPSGGSECRMGDKAKGEQAGAVLQNEPAFVPHGGTTAGKPTMAADSNGETPAPVLQCALQHEPKLSELMDRQEAATTTEAPAVLRENLWDYKRPPRRLADEVNVPARRRRM